MQLAITIEPQVSESELPRADRGEPLQQSKAFAVADDRLAIWQLLSTLTVAGALFAAMAWANGPLALLFSPLLGAVLVRLFVLQHDAGHGSLLRLRVHNERVGLALSWLSGVPFHPWRTEHHWHHLHQGKLSMRGIDRVNSPMTASEALADPAGARRRARLIGPVTVFVLGAWSLLGKRKRLRGFFPFRPGFPGRVADLSAQRRGLWATVVPHLAVHAAAFALGGLVLWAAWFLALSIGGAIGAGLFWVQHNFEHTLHADDDRWSFIGTAVRGSSYLELGALGTWLTGSIGLHHVHHLNPRIPNYRLEAARRAVPALAAVQPMTAQALRRCFTHVFWDEAAERMAELPSALGPMRPSKPAEPRGESN